MHAQKKCNSNLGQMFISSCFLLLIAIDIPEGEHITFPDICIPGPFLVQQTLPDEYYRILYENGHAVKKIDVVTPDCLNSCGPECQECQPPEEDICSFHMSSETTKGSKYKCQSSRDIAVLRMIFSRKGR